MKDNKIVNTCIMWALPLLFILASTFSAKSIYEETMEVENLDGVSVIDWNKSKHPKAYLFALINDLKEVNNWSDGERIYKLLVKADPQNGYYDALAIRILIADSFERKTEDDTELIIIKNEQNIRQAVKHLETLLTKSEYQKYSLEYTQELRSKAEKTYLGMLKDISACISQIHPELGSLREMGMIYRALDNPGPEEALRRSKNIKAFADKLINHSESYIDLLVGIAIARAVADTIQAHDYKGEEFTELKNHLKQYGKLKGALIDSEDSMKKYMDAKFSRLVSMTLPSMPAPDNFEEKLKVNRLLEYKYFDRLAINFICTIFVIAIIALCFVLLRWKISKIDSPKCHLKSNIKSIILSACLTITVLLLYSLLSNYMGSKRHSLIFAGFINIIYYSEFAALILLSISVPVMLLLNSSQNEILSPIKTKTLTIVISIALLTMLLPPFLPFYEKSILMAIFVIPWVFILYYLIKYFYLLFKKTEKEYNYTLSKILIVYSSFTGLLLIFLCQPIFVKAETELYDKDFLLRPAYDLGYALPYAETENLIRVKGHLDKLDSLPEYKNRWESKNEKIYYKLKMEMYTPPKPEVKEKTEELDGFSRSRRGRILKARQQTLEQYQKEKEAEEKQQEKVD